MKWAMATRDWRKLEAPWILAPEAEVLSPGERRDHTGPGASGR